MDVPLVVTSVSFSLFPCHRGLYEDSMLSSAVKLELVAFVEALLKVKQVLLIQPKVACRLLRSCAAF